MLDPTITLPLAFALVLPPEALEHNTKAMQFYDAGKFARAVDEFYAAYQSLPDARRDVTDRQHMMNSMCFALRDLQAQTGEAAPLCRLQSLLRGHAESLLAAFPDDPRRPEIEGARAAHSRVTQELVSFGPDACDPPSEPVALTPEPTAPPVSAGPESARPAPSPAKAPIDDGPGRRELILGGVLLPLGVAALTGLGVVASRHRRDMNEGEALHDALAARPASDADRTRMRELVTATRREEGLMVALGVTGGALVTAATALLIRGQTQRRRARLGLDVRAHRVGLTIAGEF